jgi:hypothetical protein
VLARTAEAARRSWRVNQGEKQMLGAEEEAKESLFAAVLFVAA